MALRAWHARLLVGATILAAGAHLGTALALTIELNDVAPDRVERQRRAAEGSLPLPGTPDLAALAPRLSNKGLQAGERVFVRIFKAESELELWMRNGDRFVLFDIYPICHWSGTIGPKVREGDKQNPEGFYSVRLRQLHLRGRWPRSLNLGFPNPYDRELARTGSYILIHGGCSSVGCFAMTNAVMEEIFTLAEKALKAGQDHILVHVFPFRMTDANLERFRSSEWHDFWQNLKEGYDAFEATRLPPRIGVCDNRYVVQRVSPDETADYEHLSTRVKGSGRGRGERLESARRTGAPDVASAETGRNRGRRATKDRQRPEAPAREVQVLSDQLREVIFAPR
jgi:murein L,D-transpeptidase YafK